MLFIKDDMLEINFSCQQKQITAVIFLEFFRISEMNSSRKKQMSSSIAACHINSRGELRPFFGSHARTSHVQVCVCTSNLKWLHFAPALAPLIN